MSSLQIQLLGEFRLSYGTEQFIAIDQARQRALLTYLLLHRQAPQPRRQIAFLFWPDTAEAQAHTNLRQLLYHLRRTWLAVADFVQINQHTLQWKATTACELDIATFEQALADAAEAASLGQLHAACIALKTAVEQYGGDLLPGAYDEWLLPERDRLRQCFLDAVEQLLLLCENQHDYATAIHYAQRLLRADPLHEITYARLMRLYALNHDRAAALRTYHLCTTTLTRELGVEPTHETQEAYARLLNLELPAKRPPLSTTLAARGEQLIGRQAVWATLQAAWQRAVRGHAHLVCISGEAGIGKTRLAEELLNWTRSQGIAQAHARVYAGENTLAYAPITGWLRTELLQQARKQVADVWLGEVVRLLPELLVERPTLPRPEPLTERWQRQRFFEALSHTLLSAGQPLLLVIDDLQWSDQETLEWLSYLLRHNANARLLLVVTVRPEEVTAQDPLTAFLQQLHSSNQLTEIEVDPLTPEETTLLATQVAAHAIDPVTARWIYHETEGNPLFIVETMRAASGVEVPHDPANPNAQSVIRNSPLPSTIYRVLQQRLAQLSPAAQELASLAATIGRSFAFDLLAKASAQTEDEVVRCLDELWQRRLVRVQGTNAYDFSHDRIREVAYTEISPVRRPLCHRRVAQALEAIYQTTLEEVAGQLAEQYERAGDQAQALHYYQSAAKWEHNRYLYPAAVHYANKALAIVTTQPATDAAIQLQIDLLMGLGLGLRTILGYSADAVRQTYEQAAALCVKIHDQKRFAWVKSWQRAFYGAKGEWHTAVRLSQEVIELARAIGDNDRLVTGYHSLGNACFCRGEFVAARQWQEDAYDLQVQQVGNLDATVKLRFNRAQALWFLGYPDQARQELNSMMERAKEIGDHGLILQAQGITAMIYCEAGDWSALPPLLEKILERCNHYGYLQNRLEATAYQGLFLWQTSKSAAGRNLLAEALDALRASDNLACLPYLLSFAVTPLAAGGQVEEAFACLEEATAVAEQTGEGFWAAELARLRGDLLWKQGATTEQCAAAYQHAIAIAQQQCAKSLELRATVSLARLYQRQGRGAEAYQHLSTIYDWFTEGFATTDLQAAKDLLEELSTFAPN